MRRPYNIRISAALLLLLATVTVLPYHTTAQTITSRGASSTDVDPPKHSQPTLVVVGDKSAPDTSSSTRLVSSNVKQDSTRESKSETLKSASSGQEDSPSNSDGFTKPSFRENWTPAIVAPKGHALSDLGGGVSPVEYIQKEEEDSDVVDVFELPSDEPPTTTTGHTGTLRGRTVSPDLIDDNAVHYVERIGSELSKGAESTSNLQGSESTTKLSSSPVDSSASPKSVGIASSPDESGSSSGSGSDSDEGDRTTGEMLKIIANSEHEESHDLKELSKSVSTMDKLIEDELEKLSQKANNQSGDSVSRELGIVKETVKIFSSSVNETVRDALEQLEKKEKIIQALQTRNTPANELKVDYETGEIKSSNGSIISTLYDLFLSSQKSHGGIQDSNVIDPAVLQEDFVFLKDVVFLLVAATLGGLFCGALDIPVFVGFILGGVVVGPSGFNLITKLTYVETLSQIGGPLLLFVQGLHLRTNSVKPFLRLFNRYVPVFYAAFALIMCIILFFCQLAHNGTEALLLAFCTLVSSSSVSITIAEENGHRTMPYFQNLLSWSVVQDLNMAMLLCLPVALNEGYLGVIVVVRQLAIAILLISLSVIIGLKVAPRAMKYFMHEAHPELFLMVS